MRIPGYFALLGICCLSVTSLAQQSRLDLAPKIPPSSCGISLMTVATVSGTPSYVRLRFQLDALSSAQSGVTSMATAQVEFKQEKTPAVGMSSLFTGMNQAHDALLCSASIMDRYKAVDKDDDLAKSLSIIAYNQEVKAIEDLHAHIKEQFLRTSEANQATQLKDAERISAMNALQQEAVDSLTEVTTLSLLLSVDDSDPNAKDSSQTLLSCKEFDDLNERSHTIAKSAKSGYSDTASLFATFFESHKCKK
jgi:hypothetical protein